MTFISIHTYSSPCGELVLGSYDNKLCLCDWKYRQMRQSIDTRIKSRLDAEYKEGTSEVIRNTIEQLDEYFERKRTSFDIPLLFLGTDFQQEVWKMLLTIKYGEKISYAELSKRMNNEGAIRAIASANGANAISIIVPCHRIIGTDGKLVGYAGGLLAKKKLLLLESNDKQLELFSTNE